MRAGTDATDRCIRIVREAQSIAIAGETPAKLRRHRQPARGGAEQDLAGAESAGGQDHNIGLNEARRRIKAIPAGIENLEMDAPTWVRWFDVDDPGAREDLRAVRSRVGQIGHQRRGLGAGVAARAAIATLRTRTLFHTGGIETTLEVHRNRRSIKNACPTRGGVPQSVQLGR